MFSRQLRTFRQRHRQLYKTTTCFLSSYSHPQGDNNDDAVKKKAVTEESPPRKGRPHPRNSFQGTYNMDRLVSSYPLLGPHVILGPTGRPTVDWADPTAVRALNTAILAVDYGVNPNYSDSL
mmetsp:Transcript_14486/g.26261  ORF Transcript_14486/g.26261 Transcript_14486/m.26261 type:complete len:122 (-) Transcript_14486:1148-1513(-)